jgi:hypothetical protein
MPSRKRLSSSTSRRYKLADRLLAEGSLTIRPYSIYISQEVLYILFPRDERCE